MPTEYKIRKSTSVHESSHLKIINNMCKDGWQFITAASLGNIIFFYFKRDKE